MNMELMTMAQLTLTAKYMIRTGDFDRDIKLNENIEKVIFRFAAHGDGAAIPAIEVDSREDWLKILQERGAEDVKLIIPDEIDDYGKLIVFNKVPCVMLFFGRDYVSSWNRIWTINPANNKWIVLLVESIIENPPKEKPHFSDVSQDMATLLQRLRALAQKLELSEFSFAFNAALKSLQADFVRGDEMAPANRRLMQAAADAYVFGGQGSWNDKGQAAAAAKGLTAEYEALTKDLYRGITLSMMYAVNEW